MWRPFHTTSTDETLALGEALGRVLRAGDVLALDGELGAGKTCLVRGIALGLGIDPALISSPTFVLAHQYPPKGPLGTPMVHIDAYRLSGAGDLDTIGYDALNDGHSVVVVEWASRVSQALVLTGSPNSAQDDTLARVHIRSVGENEREFEAHLPASFASREEWPRLDAIAVLAEADGNPRCAVCETMVLMSSDSAPFCSTRCRLADLNKWLTGSYVVSREVREDDLDDPDLGSDFGPGLDVNQT